MNAGCFIAAVAVAAALSADAAEKVWMDELPLTTMTCGRGRPKARMSVDGNPLSVGGRVYEHGVGTHAESSIVYRLGKKGISFEAVLGPDDELFGDDPEGCKSTLKFLIIADGKLVHESALVRRRSDTKPVKIDLRGVNELELLVDEAWWGSKGDHADYADAFFMMEDGARPEPLAQEPGEQLGILTPPAAEAPRINGAKVLGVRPNHPIVWRLPVSGVRPMELSAANLPPGAVFDAGKGILAGKVEKPGTYPIAFTARNARGEAKSTLRLVIGERIALTPPMGWNGWNVFAYTVTEQKIRDSIDVLDRCGLADHGWGFVNIDDFWQNNPSSRDDPTLQGPERHPDGSIVVNRRFSDMRALADYAHSRGFRIGIYSSPGEYTCGLCVGSWGHEWQDAKTYADWGFDYLKYDWCNYDKVAVGTGHARHMLPYRLMGEALRAQDRDIVFSLCQYGEDNVSAWGETTGGNCWRTTGDIFDTWPSMMTILERQADLWPFAHPGAWNDPDMMIVGTVGLGEAHPTRLTPNEQYTHVSMWSMLCAPLLIGCDLTKLDDFTRSLLTNDEVIEVNQDELGAQAARVAKGPRAEIWAKPMGDGSIVFALYNTHRGKTRITVDFASLGLEGRWLVRDLWTQRDLGVFADHYQNEILGHATQLVRCWPRDGGRLRAGLRDIRDNYTYSQFAETRPVDKPGYIPARGYPCAECPRRH